MSSMWQNAIDVTKRQNQNSDHLPQFYVTSTVAHLFLKSKSQA